MRAIGWAAILVLVGCSAESGEPGGSGSGRDGGGAGADAAGLDGGGGGGADGGGGPAGDGGGSGADAGDCEPPDVLIVLDRTMSMHRRPDGSQPPDTAAGHMQSKWWLAVDAIETFTAELDETMRFGLELFPRDPGGDACVTLSERIGGTTATNPQCEAGEVVVTPAIGTSGAIAAAVDAETTLLCRSTPVGAGLVTAGEEMARIASAERAQFIVLITDGQDTCDDDLPLSTVQELARSGVSTYVIGFDAGEDGTGIDSRALNDLACAGRTAPDFPAPCTDDGAGNYTATDRGGPALFLHAGDAAALTDSLEEVAGDVCCGCLI